jgi:opacity protein-like surface antigen
MLTGTRDCRSGFSRDLPGRSGFSRDRKVGSRLKPLLLAALLASASAASAGEATHNIEITPFAGYVFGGSFDSDEGGSTASQDVDLDDAASYGLIVNWPAEVNTEWEVYLSRQSTSLKVPGLFAPDQTGLADLDITFLQAGGTYFFEGERARPYIVATVGASRFEPDDSAFDSENFFAFGIGGGVKLAPTSRLGLRLEGRVLGSVVNSDSAVFCRSGPAANGCLVAVNGSMVWQWEVLAGLVFRL